MGLEWESQGQWSEPFFFIQIADPQLGMVKAEGPVGGAVWEVSAAVFTAAAAAAAGSVICVVVVMVDRSVD